MKKAAPAAFAMHQFKKGAPKKAPAAPVVKAAPFGMPRATFPLDAMHAPNAEKRRK